MHNLGSSSDESVSPEAIRNVSDLRDYLRRAEVAMADLKRGTAQEAADLVLLVNAIEKATSRLEEQSRVELKAERTRLQALESALRRNAALVVQKAGRERLQELREQTGADEADWWMRLDLMVAEQRSQQLRRLGVRVGAVVVVLIVVAAVYQLFLAPEAKPGDASAQLRQAEEYLTAGQLEEALTAYTAALEADPQGWEAPLAIGAILTQLGRTEEAQPYLDQARERLSEADFYANLSLVYYKMTSQGGVDATARAEEAALKAVEADDTSALAYLALGNVYELQGNVGQAIEALNKAASLTTDAALTASIKMRLAMLSQRPVGLPTPEANDTSTAQ